MAIPGLGHKSYVQLAPETVWGAAPSGQMTSKWELVQWNVAPVVGTIPDPSLTNRPSRRAIYQGAFKVKGTFTVRIGYEGYLELLRAVSGTYTSATVTNGRDHFFTEGSNLKSYHMEAVVGDIPTNKCFRVNGVKITSVTLKIGASNGADGMLMADCTVVAKDMLSNQTITVPANATSITTTGNATITRAAGNFTTDGVAPGMALTLTGATGLPNGLTVVTVGTNTLVASANIPANTGLTAAFTLSFPALFPVLFHQSGTVGWVDDGYVSDGSARVRSVEVTLECPHDEERFYLGATGIDEPVRNDFLVARWKFTQEFLSQTVYDAARAFTIGSPRLLFQNPVALPTNFRELEIRSGQANVVDFSAPVSGYGVLISSVTLEAFYDGTDASALYMRVRNTESALA